MQEPTSRGEVPVDEGFSEVEQQQQRQRLRQRQLEHHPLAPPPPEVPEETELPFDVQKWSSDYQYLAQAVYQADHDQSGMATRAWQDYKGETVVAKVSGSPVPKCNKMHEAGTNKSTSTEAGISMRQSHTCLLFTVPPPRGALS